LGQSLVPAIPEAAFWKLKQNLMICQVPTTKASLTAVVCMDLGPVAFATKQKQYIEFTFLGMVVIYSN